MRQMAWLLFLTSFGVLFNLTASYGERVQNGLLALYTFEEAHGSIVYDVSGEGSPLNLLVMDPGNINWISGGLSVENSTIIYSPGPATKITARCQLTNELTIEAWIKPANLVQDGPARIVTLSNSTSYRNFTLGQSERDYDVRLRLTSTDTNGHPSLSTEGGLTTELTHVVYTRDSAGIRKIYINDNLYALTILPGDFSNWDNSFSLGLANEFGLSRTWLGEFYLVAVYERALTESEVRQNYLALPNATPTPQPTSTPWPTSTPTSTPTRFLFVNPCEIVAYPNPARETVRFIWNDTQAESVRIDIYNLAGERIASLKENGLSSNNLSWDINGISPGLYLYRAILRTKNITRQSVVKKIAILR